MEVKVCEHKLSVTENGQGTAPTAETLNQTNRPRQKNSSSSTVVSCWPCVHWKKTLEAVILSCVILVVWGIFALPTIFYILPPLQSSAVRTPINSILPVCPDNDTCLNMTDGIIWSLNTSQLICAEGFYLANDSDTMTTACIPLCDFWVSVSQYTIAEDVVFAVSMIVAIVSSAILFIVALWLQRDTILVFPTYYAVYLCVPATLVATIQLARILQGLLLCSSKSYLESVDNPSPFCTFLGIVMSYLLVQIFLWGAFHGLGLTWGLVFPFHYRRFKTGGKLKYIHAITVTLGLVLPAISALLPLIEGYTLNQTTNCVGRNRAVTFFITILPISVLLAVASTSLIILLWTIFKEFVLKRCHSDKPSLDNIGIAETKISIVIFYYVIPGCLGLCSVTYFIATDEVASQALQYYFMCQSVGTVPGLDCGDLLSVRPQVFYRLSIVEDILIGFLPLVVLIFIVKWTCGRRITELKKPHFWKD